MSHARLEISEITTLAPTVYAAMTALSKATQSAGIDPGVMEMIKIRASQINGCAFCLQFHLNLARTHKVPQNKLDLLATWREAPLFSEQERAALAWTEALTRLTGRDVPDETYAQASAQFDKTQLAHLSAAIGLINAWNRIGVGYRCTPPSAA